MAKVIKNRNGTKNADSLLISKSGLTIKADRGDDTIILSKGRKNKIYGNTILHFRRIVYLATVYKCTS
jgi:hypothetical protein